jgi:regulator of protease activity HflC (stomatin/prohibitin superfamily)
MTDDNGGNGNGGPRIPDLREVRAPRDSQPRKKSPIDLLAKVARAFCAGMLVLWILSAVFLVKIRPGEIGVRQSNLSGVLHEDLGPGWHWRVPGVHKVTVLPSHYAFLDYSVDEVGPQESLQIRTKDNNIVLLDVTVPFRIKPGEAFHVVEAGNHAVDGRGMYRFARLAQENAVSVLREELANLTSSEWYTTDRRLAVAGQALAALNQSLAPLHLEAETVLVRAVSFRPEYESQLQQIQLNEQNKLLDGARQRVAIEQQKLDAFHQGTKALASAREQDWIKRQAELDRAYQVGLLETAADETPGAARRGLAAVPEAERGPLRERAAKVFGFEDPATVGDHYLLGIKNIQAETLEYKLRVTAEADGVAARLTAEADAKVAQVRGEYETRINALFGSAAGRAYVAYKSAAHVKFADKLVFHSSDGIPSVLRLRRFAEDFMGQR